MGRGCCSSGAANRGPGEFRAPPHLMFGGTSEHMRPNTLVLRVQPNEGVSLNFEVKVPGAAVALTRFAGREVVIVVLNALMGLPPVVVGLVVYLLLSRAGPLGSWGLLFTPQAMIIAQSVLVAPIIAALTRQTIEDLWTEYRDELAALDVGPFRRIATLIWDGRFSLVTALLAGFGRAAAEVGAILIVGGNIDGFTRTMTTAIALETSKGDLPLAIGLGVVLIAIVVVVNAAAWGLRRAGERFAG